MKNLYPVILTIILSLSDAFWYGWVNEKKGWLKNSLFKGWPMFGETWLPFYRLLVQWPLDISAVWIVYDALGFWSVLLMILSWYFMVKEMNYYLILGEWNVLKRFEKENVNVYWLDRLYFSGSLFFAAGFTVKNFVISYIIGLGLLILSCLIYLI